MPLLTVLANPGAGLDILAESLQGTSRRLIESTNLIDWMPMATNLITSNGTALFHQDRVGPARFFRVAVP